VFLTLVSTVCLSDFFYKWCWFILCSPMKKSPSIRLIFRLTVHVLGMRLPSIQKRVHDVKKHLFHICLLDGSTIAFTPWKSLCVSVALTFTTVRSQNSVHVIIFNSITRKQFSYQQPPQFF